MTVLTRENDVRVALMQSLNTATSMLKQAAEQGVSPAALIDDDLFKMFIKTFEETAERASREIYPPAPTPKLSGAESRRAKGLAPFWDAPSSIDYLMNHKDDEEVKRVLAPMTIRTLTPDDWKAIYKCRDRLWKEENAKLVA